MSIIVRSVQIAHIVGVILIFSICLYNISVKSESVTVKSSSGNTGALTIVNTANDDDEDGVVSVDDSDAEEIIDENLEEFRPTNEWQTVKKGQKIPPGLHVRMDFQTGQKEAKVMEGDAPQKMKQWDGGENIGIINTKEKRYTRDELKAVLKDFKYKDASQDTEKGKDNIKNNFRSYEELKKSMQDINMSVKTEGEIVTELAGKMKKPDIEPSHLKTLLVDLEYYLHQVDNAQLFCDLGGMKTMMNIMNNSHAEIRAAIAHALGAALQSNAKVQVKALDAGVMQELLKLLAVDPAPAVQKKALFALSTLIRQFPFAQKKFLKQGGLSALAQLFRTTKDDKLKIKIITLLTDLLTEYDSNVRQVIPSDKVQEERTQQYKEVDLREQMSVSGWCDLMVSLLHSQSEHDSVEKVIHAMSALVNTCQAEFSPARPKLQALLSDYNKLAQEEVEEDSYGFFSLIHSTLKKLVDDTHRDDL